MKPFPPLNAIHTVAFDFDGVFTDNFVYVDQDGRESVRCDRRDGLAFDFIRTFKKRSQLDTEFLILSKESNPVVQARASKLRIDCHAAVGNKLAYMRTLLSKRFPGIADPFAGLVYVGNDLNDLPLMRRAGYSVAPRDGHPKVLDAADMVMEEKGGDSFVRAFVEVLLGIDKLTNEEIDELVSDR